MIDKKSIETGDEDASGVVYITPSLINNDEVVVSTIVIKPYQLADYQYGKVGATITRKIKEDDDIEEITHDDVSTIVDLCDSAIHEIRKDVMVL